MQGSPPCLALFARAARAHSIKHDCRRNPARQTLRFEQLEDRRLLAVFAVNTTLDTVAVNANVSAFDATGHISLRSAIQRTNALAGADMINLPAGTYTLTRAGANEDLAATGDLDITDDLTITGAGASKTIIDAAGIPGGDRVLDILGVHTVEINDLTVTGGSLLDAPDFVYGGGIWNRQSDLMLRRVTVRNNQLDTISNTGFGGGISNGFYDANNLAVGGSLTLFNGTIRDNESDGYGGGIFNLGSASISYSIISANRALFNGGGIYHAGYGPQAEPLLLTVLNSTISNNFADVLYGGGIYNESLLEVSGCSITGNTAHDSGGGLYNFGTATLVNTTISDNQAFYIDVDGTTNNGGGISNQGTVTLLNCNIVNNRAVVQLGQAQFGGFGGGIYNFGSFSLTNTIVANNVGRHNSENCFAFFGLTSGGHNLDSDGTCGLAGAGDLIGLDPLLGPLANNGGFTQTYALLPGSPAIDAGDNANSTATDQRGRVRPVDGDGNSLAIVDIGAFEYLGSPIDVVVDGATTQAFLDEIAFVSGDLILDASARPDLMLPMFALVDGNVIISGNTALTAISMPGIAGVGGEMTIADNSAVTTIYMPNLTGTGANITITGNPAVTAISMPEITGVGGDMTIADNSAVTTIYMPNLTGTGANITITGNPAVTAITMPGLSSVGGDLTAQAVQTVMAATADGTTTVTLATAEAGLTALLTTGTFASPVAFTASQFDPITLPPEAGQDASGAAATIDPLFAYQFSFAIPTLDIDALLTFQIDVAALRPPSKPPC